MGHSQIQKGPRTSETGQYHPGSSAIARRDTLRAMPLAVTDLTNSRREILIVPRLVGGPLLPQHSHRGPSPRRGPRASYQSEVSATHPKTQRRRIVPVQLNVLKRRGPAQIKVLNCFR
jgi:hypothetical protein